MKNIYCSMLKKQVRQGIWTGYVTYYPHKKAYRTLPQINFKKEWGNVKKLNLYVHIPFCNKKCTFCNLFSTVLPDDDKANIYESYVQKIKQEISFYKTFVSNDAQIVSLYFGGGTPNALKCEQLCDILAHIKQEFPNWSDDIEVCTECYPELLTKQYMQALQKGGFKRLSIGVQSLEQNELQAINRSTSFNSISLLRQWATELGLHINFDLIYGLPHQTKASFLRSLKKIISLNPQSICTYPLAVRPHTGICKANSKSMLTTKQKYSLFPCIRKTLEQSGYSCETVVRFVKSASSTCQQERLEYQGIPTLGIGAGARSYSPLTAYCITYKVQNNLVKGIIDEYMLAEPASRMFDGYCYTLSDLKARYVMLHLLEIGVNEQSYNAKFKSNLMQDFALQFKALKKLRLIAYQKQHQTHLLTRKGMQYCDLIANIFVSSNVQALYNSYKPE